MDPVNRPVHYIFDNAAMLHPDSPCLDFLDNKFTYGEILDLMHRFASGLQKMGIEKGDRVGLCLPNCPYFIVAYYAAMKIGATVVNFNLLYTEAEIRQQILDSGISTMVVLDVKAIYGKIFGCLKSTQLSKIIYCSLADVLPPLQKYLFKILKFYQIARINKNENIIAFDDVISHGKEFSPASIDPMNDIALLQYTGGTTGIPKAAMLTHSNVVSNTRQVTLWLKTSGETVGGEDGGQEKFLAVIPFFHVFSMTAVMNMGINRGAEIILLPRFYLKQTLQVIDRKKPTIFAAVPAIFNAINNYKKLSKYDLTSLSSCISGGAPLPVTVKDTFEKHTGGVLVEGYGLSETSPVVTCNPPHSGGKSGSIGLPLPGTEVEIRCLKDISKSEKTREKGELVVRGPQVMQGYWNRALETKETLLDAGWLRTGDIGYIDEEGYVFLTDRLKEIIIVNGYNVYPGVIEDAFYHHRDVSEVIVIGIPDEAKGEIPKAFVKLKHNSSVNAQELLDFALSRLNPIERPGAIEIRNELPKTLMGKLSKKQLLEEETRKRNKQS